MAGTPKSSKLTIESAKNYSDGHYKLTQILHIQHDDFFYLSPHPGIQE